MTKYEEIYLISALLSKAKTDKSVDLNDSNVWEHLFLYKETRFHEDYFLELNDKGFLDYEEIGEDGFKPILICSIKSNTETYLKQLINDLRKSDAEIQQENEYLKGRINEILTFNPDKLSSEIETTESIIQQTREQINSNPVLQSLSTQLDQIEIHFNSLSKVANNYLDIYKNIILPVKEEGKSGVRQTVKWAVISIIVSTILSVISVLISWKTN